MKKNTISIAIILAICNISFGQNIGIGTPNPLMKLHVSSSNSELSLLENAQNLNSGVSTGLYFKTGNGSLPFTGAMKTIGESNNQARLGLFTYASVSAAGLKERLSITDKGRVGIGVTAPQAGIHLDPAGAGSILIGTDKNSGGFTNLEMGISSQNDGYSYLQSTKASGSDRGVLAINAYGGNVGIGTATPSSTLDIDGGISMPIKLVSNDYFATNKDYTIVVDMKNNKNINRKVYLPEANLGRIINVIGLNLPNRFLASQFGPTNVPNGKVLIVNEDGSQLNYVIELSYSSGQQQYPFSGDNSTTIKLYESVTNVTFQYVNAQIGWVIINQSHDSFEDYN